MKVVMFQRPVQYKGQTLVEWTPYCVFDAALQMLLPEIQSQDVMVREVGDLPWWDGQRPVEKMLILGGGGAGDRVQATPALRKLYAKLGNRPFDVCCDAFGEWEGLPYIANHHPWLPRLDLLASYDALLTFEDLLGKDNERTTHIAELIAERLHVAPLWAGTQERDPGEFRCEYVMRPEEERALAMPEKPEGKQWVALQWASNGNSRNYPVEHLTLLATMLAARQDTTVLIVGSAGQGPQWATPCYDEAVFFPHGHILPRPLENVANLCGQFDSLRRLAVLLRKCDLVISPDSGPLHVAGALGVPSIGLYGPHTWETRGKYFPEQRPLFVISEDDRCPCYTHEDQRGKGLPCGRNVCLLLASISPMTVYEAAVSYLDELRSRHADANGDSASKGAVVGGGRRRKRRGPDDPVHEAPLPTGADVGQPGDAGGA
jgi:ADP-heptose:LPS heptosyltransferase